MRRKEAEERARKLAECVKHVADAEAKVDELEKRLASSLSWSPGGAEDRAPQWLRTDLVGILDQAGKNQWLNVAYRAFDVVERAWTEFLAVGGAKDKFDLLRKRMSKLAGLPD